tara:strand:+ start:596 stop:922 length:327 start_codon:yes stop_codon:yes gene_type:complete
MAFSDKSEFRIPRHIVQPGGVNAETLSTNKTLVYSDSPYQLLKNTGGAIDCTLPAYKDGCSFWIKSRSSSVSNIVVKDPDGNILATLAAGNAVLCVSNATAWWDVIAG